jgi:hypothetical protein
MKRLITWIPKCSVPSFLRFFLLRRGAAPEDFMRLRLKDGKSNFFTARFRHIFFENKIRQVWAMSPSSGAERLSDLESWGQSPNVQRCLARAGLSNLGCIVLMCCATLRVASVSRIGDVSQDLRHILSRLELKPGRIGVLGV